MPIELSPALGNLVLPFEKWVIERPVVSSNRCVSSQLR